MDAEIYRVFTVEAYIQGVYGLEQAAFKLRI